MTADLNNQSVLVTGGTGSFGKAFVQSILEHSPNIKRLVIVSRDEQKHHEMMTELSPATYPALEYRLGDVIIRFSANTIIFSIFYFNRSC